MRAHVLGRALALGIRIAHCSGPLSICTGGKSSLCLRVSIRNDPFPLMIEKAYNRAPASLKLVLSVPSLVTRVQGRYAILVLAERRLWRRSLYSHGGLWGVPALGGWV